MIADSYFVQIFTVVCWNSSYHCPLPYSLNNTISDCEICEVCQVSDREGKDCWFFLQIGLSETENNILESTLIKNLAGSPDTLSDTTNLKANPPAFSSLMYFSLCDLPYIVLTKQDGKKVKFL